MVHIKFFTFSTVLLASLNADAFLAYNSMMAVPHSTTCTMTRTADIDDASKTRRTFFSSTALILSILAGTTADPSRASSALDYKAVASDISELVMSDPDKGPTLVRLAWHSSGTYDKLSKTGGSGLGTIRFKEELAHGGNAGLASTAIVWLEPLKKKYGAALSYADLYTLAGGTVNVS